ncbi:histidinol-phosphate transaminase [Pseudoflavonifractor capillosus]|uniref:histidinol-phosphate transaminase n=1 Tax=Pseudoflavonifractor capillosus TaxID=106588 RepID=UPI0019567C26|nr:histidinol-phosphate transaminase [Pseudoflavonifractor capillosus]MBM6897017.1 histidinol-phosphate transaminase [Pseudoflavonifractor capillosus]
MKEFWSRRIVDAVPYVPGEQPKGRTFVKLNTNECPYPPSPKALEAITRAANETLRLYPDPECLELRQTIARREGLSANQVFCGNGSDEVLAFAFQAFFDPDKEIVFPQITYSFYPVYTSYFGLTCRRVPMNSDFSAPVEELMGKNGGVVLCNPNAPTGIGVPRDVVERLLNANPDVVVIVDEAYVDFGGESSVGLIDRYPNLLVIQTASKSRALAGLRVGWAMGNENLIQALCCVRDSINSYPVDRLAQAGAAAAIQDEDYFEQTCRKVMATRERTAQRLREMGYTVLPSQANFLFVSHPDKPGKALLDGLRQRGVLVRWWSDPMIESWLRISIGTDQEMDTLLSALQDL